VKSGTVSEGRGCGATRFACWRRMQRNLTPLGGAVDDQQNIADIRGFEHGSAMRDFSINFVMSSSAEKSKRPPARRNSRNLSGQFLCSAIQWNRQRGKSGNSPLARGEEA